MKQLPRVALLCLALALAPALCAAQFSIHAEVWARPRSGETLLRLPALRELLREFDRNPGARIEIRYPGGEAGTLWALELQDWLVALGVPARYIDAVPGSGVEDSVHLLINKAESE